MKTLLLVCILSSLAFPLVAQAQSEVPAPVVSTPSEDARPGKQEYEKALIAKENGEYEKALGLLEKASFKENNAVYLFEYAILLDLMGDTVQGLRVLDQNADAMKAHPDITTFSLVHQKFQNKLANQSDVDAPSLVGPIVAGVGVASLITGVVFIVLSQGTKADALCSKGGVGSKGIEPTSQNCDDPISRTRQEIDNKFDTADSQLIIGSVLSGVGLGAAALGTVLWLNDDTKVSTTINPLNNKYSVNVQLRF